MTNEQLAKKYASKYINDGDLENLSSKSLYNVFKNCVIPAKRELYPSIREFIVNNII